MNLVINLMLASSWFVFAYLFHETLSRLYRMCTKYKEPLMLNRIVHTKYCAKCGNSSGCQLLYCTITIITGWSTIQLHRLKNQPQIQIPWHHLNGHGSIIFHHFLREYQRHIAGVVYCSVVLGLPTVRGWVYHIKWGKIKTGRYGLS